MECDPYFSQFPITAFYQELGGTDTGAYSFLRNAPGRSITRTDCFDAVTTDLSQRLLDFDTDDCYRFSRTCIRQLRLFFRYLKVIGGLP